MKQIFIITCCLIILTGCGGNNPVKDEAGNIVYYIDPDEGPGYVKGEWGEYYIHDSLPFLGNMLYQNKSNIAHTRVLHQIKEITANDSVLSYDGRVLTVCGVRFGINICKGDIYLYSSTSIEDPRMQSVIEYLNGVYCEGQTIGGHVSWGCHMSRYGLIILAQEENATLLEIHSTSYTSCGRNRLHRLDGKYEKHWG